MLLDRFLLDHTTGPTLEVAASIVAGRAALAGAAADLLAIPDSALDRGWEWRDDEADVRYGLYRGIEATEAAAATIARILRATGADRPAAADRIAPATIARWDLHGVLIGLEPADLDRHHGAEWTVRETLAHIVNGQRAYAWYTAWWVDRPREGPTPDGVPEEVREAAGLPDEEVEGEGSLEDIRARLDAILDLSASRLAGLDEAALGRPARWAGIPVDIGFRLGRWSSHLVEHTVQVEKTLAALGRRPSEVARLVRRLHAAWGRLEALVFPMDETALARGDRDGRTVDAVLGSLGAELRADARSARDAARS